MQQLGGGQPLAPGAGAEGQILGLDLAQVRLACPGAMLAHLEKNQHHLAQLRSQIKVKKGDINEIYFDTDDYL